MERRCEIQSFDLRTLILVEEQHPLIPTFYLIEDPTLLSTTFTPRAPPPARPTLTNASPDHLAHVPLTAQLSRGTSQKAVAQPRGCATSIRTPPKRYGFDGVCGVPATGVPSGACRKFSPRTVPIPSTRSYPGFVE